ncbi:MAG: DUF721 domain-containing protein [Ignavibacteria bacterium]
MFDIKSFSDVFNNDESLSKLRIFVQQTDVVQKFTELFPDLRKIAKAVKLEKKVLYLSIENSVWRSELKFKQKIIIDRINEHFKSELVKYIKFIA